MLVLCLCLFLLSVVGNDVTFTVVCNEQPVAHPSATTLTSTSSAWKCSARSSDAVPLSARAQVAAALRDAAAVVSTGETGALASPPASPATSPLPTTATTATSPPAVQAASPTSQSPVDTITVFIDGNSNDVLVPRHTDATTAALSFCAQIMDRTEQCVAGFKTEIEAQRSTGKSAPRLNEKGYQDVLQRTFPQTFTIESSLSHAAEVEAAGGGHALYFVQVGAHIGNVCFTSWDTSHTHTHN